MKKRISGKIAECIFLTVIFAFLFMNMITVQATGGAYDNIIGDYECTNAGSWASDINKSIDNSIYHSGSSSLKVSAASGNPLSQFSVLFKSSFYNSFPIENGQNYYYSFWLKTSNTNLASYGVYTPYYYTKSGESQPSFASPYYHTKNLENTTDWQYVTGSFTANLSDFANNPGATPLELYFTVSAWDTGGSSLTNADIWVDQVCLRKVPDTDINKTTLISMEKVANESDSSLIDGAALTFDSTYVDTDNLVAFIPKVNDSAVSFTCSFSKDESNHTTSLSVLFNNPISKANLYSFDIAGLFDLWGREICCPTGAKDVEYDNIISDYECANGGSWSSDINKSIDNSVYHSGNSSLKVSAASDKPLSQYSVLFKSSFYNSFPIENGQSYYYSFWLKTSNTNLASYGLYTPYYYTKSGETLASFAAPYYHTKSLKNTTDWQYVTSSFTANLSDYANNAGATPLELYFSVVAWDTGGASLTSADIRIDQVNIRKIPQNSFWNTNLTSTSPLSGTENISDSQRDTDFSFDTQYLDTSSTDNAQVSINGGIISKADYTINTAASATQNTMTAKLTLLNDSILLKGKTVTIQGLTDLWGRYLESSANFPGGYTLSDYTDTSTLLEENFLMTYSPPDENTTHASGWDTDESGGYIQGRNSLSSFEIVDNSTSNRVIMSKELAQQTTGMLSWEFKLLFTSTSNNTAFKLGNDENTSVMLRFADGNIYYECSNAEYLIGTYQADTLFGIKAIIDLDNHIASVYCNGIRCIFNMNLYSDCSVSKISISTGEAQTEEVYIKTIRINKDYIINEKFITCAAGSFNFTDWQKNEAGGSVSIYNGSENAFDPNSVLLTDNNTQNAVYIQKSFDNISTGTLAWEYKFYAEQLSDFTLAEIKGNDTTAFKLSITQNGTLYYGNDSTNQIVCGYRADLWYNIKILLNMSDKTAAIYVNHKLKCSDIPFLNSVSLLNSIKYSTSNAGTGNLRIDDITLNIKQPEPEDYVPAPEPAESDYLISMLSCSLWKEGNHRGWDSINRFDERTPLLGFYDEGNVEEADWEIKWLVEHGIGCQIFCWYNSNGAGYPIKTPEASQAIDAYMDAKYSNLMDFSIMWTNASTTSEVFRNTIVPYWIEYYFKDSRYLKINNKPVLYIFSKGDLYNGFGNYDGVKAEIDYLNAQCIQAGFAGVNVCLYPTLNNITAAEKNAWKSAGIKAFFTYGQGDYTNIGTVVNRYIANPEYIPVLSMKMNMEAWTGLYDRYTSPDMFREMAEWFRDDFLPYNDSGIGEKMLIIDNWNELGEGHYVMPTEKLGFSNLDVIRDVFTAGGTHTDAVPTQTQKSRFNKLYSSDRQYYEAPLLSKAPTEVHILKTWDFSTAQTIEFTSDGISNLRLENNLLKGTINSNDPMIICSGLNIDISSSHIIKIKMKSAGDLGQVFFGTLGNGGFSANRCVSFSGIMNDGYVSEYIIDMRTNSDWTGILTDFRLDIPGTVNDTFEIEFISIMSGDVISAGDNIAENGDFENDSITGCFTANNCTASVQHHDFYYGAGALKVTKQSTDSSIEYTLPDTLAPQSYYYRAYAKLPYDSSVGCALQACVKYTQNGVQYTQNLNTSNLLSRNNWTVLEGDFTIGSLGTISNIKLSFFSDIPLQAEYYLDDILIQPLSSKFTSSIEPGETNAALTDNITFTLDTALDVSDLSADNVLINGVNQEGISFDFGSVISDCECTAANSSWGSSLNKSVDNITYHSGNSSLKLSASSNKTLSVYDTVFDSQFCNYFPIENGKSYHYSFWMKTSNTALSSIGVYTPYYYQKSGETTATYASPYYHTKNLNGTTWWQHISGTFTANLADYTGNTGATPLEQYFRIVAWNTGGASLSNINIWIDQVCLWEVHENGGINSFALNFENIFEANTEYSISISGLNTENGQPLPSLKLNFTTGGELIAGQRIYYKDYGTASQQEVPETCLSGTVTVFTPVYNQTKCLIEGKHVVAVYDQGQMVYMNGKDFDIGALSSNNFLIEINANQYDKIKEFFWSDWGNLKPYI